MIIDNILPPALQDDETIVYNKIKGFLYTCYRLKYIFKFDKMNCTTIRAKIYIKYVICYCKC